MKLQDAKKHLLLSVFIALVLASTVYPTKAQAQIIDQLDVNIPFQFHAGSAKLPAGQYIVQILPDSDMTIMEIKSANDSTSALLEVRDTQANGTPAKSELIFNKYGNRYFLEKAFEEGSPNGSQVTNLSYEKRVGQAAADGEEHVPAHKRGKQGT
jgi:hypothetical protein